MLIQIKSVERSSIMKKVYGVPVLINHGNLNTITQVFGKKTRKDFAFFNGANISPSIGVDTNGDGTNDAITGLGSGDGIINRL
jgi:hypothetical protein